MLLPRLTLLGFALFIILPLVLSSPGDKSKHYIGCINSCPLRLCPNPSPQSSTLKQRPSHFIKNLRNFDPNWVNPDPLLALLQWDCVAECKYECMHETQEEFHRAGKGFTKFYGKWPFVRVLGMQEVVSSVTSFLNAVPHVYALLTRSRYAPPSYYMSKPLLLFSLICINSWLWSGIFHARDTPFTEAADYFFATSQLLYSAWMAVHRISHDTRLARVSMPLAAACLVAYYWYVSYMLNVKFDYGMHMKINTALVVAHYLLWVLWAFVLPSGRTRPYRFYSLAFLTLILLAASCEVFDFAPLYGVFDAHAAWHSMTWMMIPIWYKFWREDSEYEVAVRKMRDAKEKRE
jgi:hypothetical protein